MGNEQWITPHELVRSTLFAVFACKVDFAQWFLKKHRQEGGLVLTKERIQKVENNNNAFQSILTELIHLYMFDFAFQAVEANHRRSDEIIACTLGFLGRPCKPDGRVMEGIKPIYGEQGSTID